MKEKGFTLIELLIALSLFVLSILLLFQLVLLAMRVNVLNAKRNQAVMIAFSESEKVKGKRFEDLPDGFKEFTIHFKDGTYYFVHKTVRIPLDREGKLMNEMREVKVGIYWGWEFRVWQYIRSTEFSECMKNKQNIEECKNYPHHSYESTFYITEAI